MYGSNEYGSIPYGSNGGPFQTEVNNEINSEIAGKSLENSEINSQVTGKGIPDEINSEIRGKSLENSEINSEITGLPITDEINSEIEGLRNKNNEINSEITGALHSTDINSEIIGKKFLPIERTYRIIVKDADGNIQGEFDQFRSLKFGKRLNNYGTASFEIPVSDEKASELVALRKYTVWIYYQVDGTSTLVWSGEQAMREGSLDNEGNNWCTIYCFDWLEQLNGRYTASFKRYENVDAGQIAWDLIDVSQKDFQPYNTGLVLPGTPANDATIGTIAWTSVDNIKVDDTNKAFSEPEAVNKITNYIKATNFGLSVPADAEILGVKVQVKAEAEDVSATNYVYSSTVKLIKGGTIQTENLGNDTHWADVADADIDKILEYGGATELWGTTLSASDVNASTFGVALSATGVTSTTIPCAIFYIKLIVYYSAPSGSDHCDFGITEGTIDATMNRDRTYYNQNIMEAIINLSGVISGFDFEITNDKVFNASDVIGVDRTNEIILEYGHNIESAQIVEDFVHPVNRAIVLGQSTDDLNDLVRVERNNLTSQAEFRLREDVLSEMNVSETDTMEEKGDAMLRKYENPLMKIDINMASVQNPNITEFGLGDAITLIIKSGIYNIHEDYRVFEWEVTYEDNNTDHLTVILGNFTYE